MSICGAEGLSRESRCPWLSCYGNGRDVLDPGDDVFEGNLVGGGAADTFHVSVGQQFNFYDLNLAQGDVEVID